MKRGLDPTILAEGIDSDVHELRKSIVSALTVARGLSEAQTSATTPNLQRVDETLAQISQILATSPHTKESRTILELLGRLSQIIKTETTDENLMDRIPLQDAPPVWFERVPRAGGPVVDVQALAGSVSGSDSAASGFENFLDGIFSPLSSDTIYEAALRKLRHQLIELYNRNLALELNLDMAEREVRHWRSLYISDPRHMPSTQPQSPSSPKKSILQREIKVVAWKHAVEKFIGSFDQFSMLKVLLHWRLYVQEERRS
jgi:hypothetical protein